MSIQPIPKTVKTPEDFVNFYKSERNRLHNKIEKMLKKETPTARYTIEEAKQILLKEFQINPEMKLPTPSMFKYNQKKLKRNADVNKYIELKNIITQEFDKHCQLWRMFRDLEIENIKYEIAIVNKIILVYSKIIEINNSTEESNMLTKELDTLIKEMV